MVKKAGDKLQTRQSIYIKSAMEKLKESGVVSKPVDIDPDWYGKHLRAKAAAEEEARKAEETRIKKIKCPSCKSTSKNHIVKRNDNGIIGPGYSSWVIDEYFVCNKCGTMFKDMEKIKKNLKEGRIR
jgi:transposase-like protein